MMFEPNIVDLLIHDSVVQASASTYAPQELARLGLQMDLNLSNKKIRAVNGVYPDIVVWKPDYLGSTAGQAVLVEIIETGIPLNPDINKWISLCSLGIRVNIVTNESQKNIAVSTIGQYELSNCFLQTYTFDNTTKRYTFTTV